MKSRTVASATLFAAMAITQSAAAATIELPKLSERKPAQAATETQIGCQSKGANCASQPRVDTIQDSNGREMQIVVCVGDERVVHAAKLKFCVIPPAPAL